MIYLREAEFLALIVQTSLLILCEQALVTPSGGKKGKGMAIVHLRGLFAVFGQICSVRKGMPRRRIGGAGAAGGWPELYKIEGRVKPTECYPWA
jgi:hypothetical protein